MSVEVEGMQASQRGASSARMALYVALGDSFSAGSGCKPGEEWPARLAAALRRGNPRLGFRNLATHGASSDDVLEQLPEALELEPGLVTVVCGTNDVLNSTRPDHVRYARNLALVFDRLQRSNPEVRIATATAPESWGFLELGPRTRARVEVGIRRLNAITRNVAAIHRVACLDVAEHGGLGDRANFAADGLHPSPLGHASAADAFGELVRQRYQIEPNANDGGRG